MSTHAQIIATLAQQILSKLPVQFDVEEVSARFPTTYKESMNTVLTQVCFCVCVSLCVGVD